jgi:hypothetical protein
LAVEGLTKQVHQYCLVPASPLTPNPLYLSHPAGEFCPQGTQEETSLSIATCQLNPASYSASGSAAGGSLGACRGFKACPAGSFCPNASVAQPCVAGSYCPPGSLKGDPCNITVSFLSWNVVALLVVVCCVERNQCKVPRAPAAAQQVAA